MIVLSLTVSRAGAFAADAQRLNVALTRARHHLVVVGAAPVAQVYPPQLVHADLLVGQLVWKQGTSSARISVGRCP